MNHFFSKRYALFLNAGLAVAGVIACKLLAHLFGLEALSVNPLFSGIIAANVFLMGFLLSGVMSDYKESERLPGELASAIESLVDEAVIVNRFKDKNLGADFLASLLSLTQTIEDWFYKRTKTEAMMHELRELQGFFNELESVTQANFIARLKQEQSNIRRMLLRIRTIRDTSFIPSGYMIATTTTTLLMAGLVFVEIEPFYESIFFVGVISFLMAFLLLLIRDLDNPFGYYESSSMEEVSLAPLKDVAERIRKLQSHTDDSIKV